MKKSFALFILGAICSGAAAQDSKCAEVIYDYQKLFQVMAEVEGPRGSLRFPAILDTGASKTLIPSSIMEGIGYSSKGINNFNTADGQGSFDSGNVRSLSFLNIIFNDPTIYIKRKIKRKTYLIETRKEKNNRIASQETGIIGMSELAQTSFKYKDGVLTICSKEEK